MMDWIGLAIFGLTIVFFAGIWVATIRGLKGEIVTLKEDMKLIREHNEFQDKQISETHTTSQVILAELKHIASSLEELKVEHKDRVGCAFPQGGS